MGHFSNKQKKYLKSAAHACAGCRYVPETSHEASFWAMPSDNTATNPIILLSDPDSDGESNNEVCNWTGSVNNHLENDPKDWIDLSSDMDSDLDDEIEELEGEELWKSLEAQMAHEAVVLEAASYWKLSRNISPKEWHKAEMNRGLGYTGRKTVATFTGYFMKPSQADDHQTSSGLTGLSTLDKTAPENEEIFTGYLSDLSDDDEPPPSESEQDEDNAPPTKQRHVKLAVPAHIA
ncbi:hypothetical protein BDQ12DRAFT_671177 [Crucibulum laeve]|uniref:Uncharacterized protein n=1 Tax=Crucibulum laeve TaxID=68775 RepID=A0A5C3LGN0_9AGAR|nr:hypothetical protein BDQ12DRAFT_671177 [Crucibulum laeve]